MELFIAGGCGEHGRNCFHVTGAAGTFLVDCGVMAGEGADGYPRLSPGQIDRLGTVFLTHSHGDHAGALPWLLERGYTGRVVASRHTLAQLPFSLPNGVPLEELCPHGRGAYRELDVAWGRTGHCVGSVWYRFTEGGKTILFSGDYPEHSQVYARDPLRGQTADLAVLDCAYGRGGTSYEIACGALGTRVDALLETYPLLLFPVPKYGRGLELLRLLRGARPGLPCCGDSHFMGQLAATARPDGWLKPLPGDFARWASPLTGRETAGLVFVSDPQLRSPAAQTLARGVLDRGGHGVMTGTPEADGYSARLLAEGRMELLRYPVHLGCPQFKALERENKFARTIPYHSADFPACQVTVF